MLFLPLIQSQAIIYTEEERGDMESPWSLPFEILGIEMSSQETKRNAKNRRKQHFMYAICGSL